MAQVDRLQRQLPDRKIPTCGTARAATVKEIVVNGRGSVANKAGSLADSADAVGLVEAVTGNFPEVDSEAAGLVKEPRTALLLRILHRQHHWRRVRERLRAEVRERPPLNRRAIASAGETNIAPGGERTVLGNRPRSAMVLPDGKVNRADSARNGVVLAVRSKAGSLATAGNPLPGVAVSMDGRMDGRMDVMDVMDVMDSVNSGAGLAGLSVVSSLATAGNVLPGVIASKDGRAVAMDAMALVHSGAALVGLSVDSNSVAPPRMTTPGGLVVTTIVLMDGGSSVDKISTPSEGSSALRGEETNSKDGEVAAMGVMDSVRNGAVLAGLSVAGNSAALP